MIAFIPFLEWRIADKHTPKCTCIELCLRARRVMYVCCTTEDAGKETSPERYTRKGSMKTINRACECQSLRGKPVDKVGTSQDSLAPIRPRNMVG